MPEAMPMPAASPENAEQQTTVQPETTPATPERQSQPASLPPITALSPTVVPQQGSVATTDVATTTVSTPLMADDNDLIEKEWVIKAKEIVERTKDDPYRQSKDMTVFRADYMQKRYNKTIKLSE